MACRCWARWRGSSLPPPPGQRAPTLQTGDLLLQQFVLEQHVAEPRFQPLALERLAIRGPGRQGGLTRGKERITPCGQRSGRYAERARHRLQVLAAQQTEHRVPLALPRHPSASAKSNRILSRRLCRHPAPLSRTASAYEVSHSTVGRRI